ncbi:hypothetical protein ACKKBG_A24740 [Auxenochlorella protothecoides x Auxenochlorella symbiontica]
MGSVWRMLNCTLSCTGNVTHELTDSALLGLSKERAWGRWSFLFAARGGPLGFGLAVLGAIVFVRRRNAREGALARLPEQTVAKAQGYCLLRLLGVGHYGRVYLARQESTRQHFAIKVITVYTPRQLEAAYAECRTMLGIRHPHCAQVHSYFSARMEHSLRSVDGNSGSDAYLEQAFQLQGPDAAASPASSAATGTGSLVSTLWRATRLRGSGSSSSDAGTAPSSLAMQVHMVVEFCDHGTLEAAVQSGIFLDPALGRPRMDWVLQTVLEVASGLEYLHAPGRRVVHRDLSAGNVLLASPRRGGGDAAPGPAAARPASTRPFRAVISDFGLSMMLSAAATHRTSHMKGTVAYMSPEVFRTSDVTPALDIYSLGIIMYYVYMGSLPYPDRNPGQVIVEKMREVECGAEERFDIPRDCPAFYRQLILDCTHPQRRERPNAGELVRRLSILLA